MMRRFVLLALLAGAASAQEPQKLPPDIRTKFALPDTTKLSATQRAIIRIELSRSPAIARNDSATLRRIYSPDFKGVTAIGTEVSREDLLAVFARDEGWLRFTIDQIDVKPVGSTMVYGGRLSTFHPGGALLGRSVFMHVYERRDGRWQIIRAQGTQQRLASTRGADSAAIRASIEKGARGFMNANPDSILSHYGRDIVLSYPGIPDQDYAQLVEGYGQLRSRPPYVTAATVPTFDEILVGNDLAIVRVRWTTTIKSAARDTIPERTSTRTLRDLQVWRKEPSGTWSFIRGMHYPDSTAASPRR